MDSATRQRMANIAARLASDHDGEVLNAARLLVRAVTAEGMTIADLLAPPPATVDYARSWGFSSNGGKGCPPHVAKIDQLLDLRWAMLRSHRTDKLLRTMRLAATLADDEQEWLDALFAKMVRLRSKAVADARVNMAEDFTV